MSKSLFTITEVVRNDKLKCRVGSEKIELLQVE